MAAAADRPKTRKPISTTAKGAYYKARSKKWLLARGYAVANMEELRMIYGPPLRRGGKPQLLRAVRKDQFGADLHGIRRDPPDSVYVQVKFGQTARIARSGLAAARREFRGYPFPDFVRRVIHVWLLRAREPEIIDCSSEVYDPCEAQSRKSTPTRTTAF